MPALLGGSPDDHGSQLARQLDILQAIGRVQGFLTHEDVTRLLSVVSDITPDEFESVLEALERERIELVDETDDSPDVAKHWPS